MNIAVVNDIGGALTKFATSCKSRASLGPGQAADRLAAWVTLHRGLVSERLPY
jgi:hypothetical protein